MGCIHSKASSESKERVIEISGPTNYHKVEIPDIPGLTSEEQLLIREKQLAKLFPHESKGESIELSRAPSHSMHSVIIIGELTTR
ncbi:MAG: hypothetical protein M1824_001590 [Vezdaea acicularis]|nr:MAG: hypothetical protein M1824_001590 [Vezdaea acicularis]